MSRSDVASLRSSHSCNVLVAVAVFVQHPEDPQDNAVKFI